MPRVAKGFFMLLVMSTQLDEILKDRQRHVFQYMTEKERSIGYFASRSREEYYLPHVILKISRNTDVNDHVFGATL
jgi:hypothetical protein